MIVFITSLLLLGWRTILSNGLPGVIKPTATTQAGPQEPARSPHPTPAAVLPQKRDDAGNRTCGFVDGEFGPSPLTCNNALQTCVLDEMDAVAGCCGTTSVNQTLGYFVNCGFYSGCADYSDSNTLTHLSGAATSTGDSGMAPISSVNVSVSPLIRHALSCSAASPFCATYPFTYDELTYSMLGCHSTSGKFSLRPLSYLATYTQPLDNSPSSPPSSNTNINTSISSHSATRSGKKLAEIIAPSVVGGLVIGAALVLWLIIFRRRSTRKKRLRDKGKGSSPIQPGEGDLMEPRRKYISQTSKDAFLVFLSSYGPSGASLRELIMLGTLRQAGEKSNNHWSMNGEVGSLKEVMPGYVPESQSRRRFMDDFMNAVRDSGTVVSFEAQLKYSGLIHVEYPEGIQSDETNQYWLTDGRVWIIRADQSSERSKPIGDPTVLQELLDVFMEMPDKDVFPAAQRQREVYHYHAHLLIRRIIQSREHLDDNHFLLARAVFLTLQLLTHRFQTGDSLLLDFVRDKSVGALHPDMGVMLLWAELKEKAFEEDYDGLCTIRDRALSLMNSNEIQSHATPRQNGFLGFVLVDLMKNARASHFEDIVADVVKMGTKWADITQTFGTRTSIENTALCEILATFNIHARNNIIPKEYFVFYGYHLSRAGFLVQGDQFLARGLKNRDSIPLWSYEMERVSNALRLGRHNEAAQMLKSIRQPALHNRDDGPYSILWKHSGECSETFILLYLYEADCSASAGRLDDACAELKSGISITSSVHDAYIRILRVTLEIRLVEVLIRQGKLEEALPVALNLISEILDERTSSTLASDIIYGIVQQSLDLSNSLLSAENAAASMVLLRSVTDTRFLLPVELSNEIKSYVEQRIAKARQFSGTNELSEHHQTPSTLDTSIEDPITLVQTNPNPTTPKAIKEATLMSGALEAPSSSQTWKTGVEDPVTQAQTDPGNEPTLPKRKETIILANASLPARLPNPTDLQTLARKSSERDRQSSSKSFQSKAYASTRGKLRRAPRPPSTEPEKSASAYGEKAMQQEEVSSRMVIKPSVMIPRMH